MMLHTRMSRKKRKLNKSGFTLAELLITAGILAILASFGFVAVVTYQRQLKATEMDATAKELFIAAQNHMTALDASGEWDSYAKAHEGESAEEKETFFGKAMGVEPSDYTDAAKYGAFTSMDHEFHYLTVNTATGGADSALEDSILSEILPFGSIDDTVRADGSYVIEYDYQTATVYGVFYTDNSKKLSYDDVKKLNSSNGRTKKEVREKYKRSGERIIIGYYGGALAKNLEKSDAIKAPTVVVENDDLLKLKITDTSYTSDIPTRIQVRIVGEESGQTMVCPLELQNKNIDKIDYTKRPVGSDSWWKQWSVLGSGTDANPVYYEFVLDDITSLEKHFAKVCPDFIPGENLLIQVSCSTNYALTTAKSISVYTNSLFSSAYKTTSVPFARTDFVQMTAEVNCVRHLENLSPEISNVPMNPRYVKNNTNVISSVVQTANIIWSDTDDTTNDFKTTVGDTASICSYQAEDFSLSKNEFLGIKNNALSSYEGNGKSINGLTITSSNANVGLFSQIGGMTGIQSASQNLSVSNLTLNNIVVNGTGTSDEPVNAGILVGAAVKSGNDMAQLTATNVFVKNPTVSIQYGNAGGVAGSLAKSEITNCGVFGSNKNIDGGSRYYASATDPDNLVAAVYTANGISGGMIGELTGKDNKLTDSFSAVAVASGRSEHKTSQEVHVAGGLIGANNGTNSVISNCYVGGHTIDGEYDDTYWNIYAGGNGGIAGGFVGEVTQSAIVNNCYTTASATASKEEGAQSLVGGFIGSTISTPSTYTDCYTTGKVQANAVGAFCGSVPSGTFENCSYVANINEDTVLASPLGDKHGIKEKTYVEITKDAHNTNGNTLVFPYDTGIAGIFPYPTVNKTASTDMANTKNVHYGDWPKEQEDIVPDNIRAGLVYYEYINGSDYLYYQGYGNDRTKISSRYPFVTERGKYVREEGYLLILPAEATPNRYENDSNTNYSIEFQFANMKQNGKDQYFPAYNYLKKDANGEFITIDVGNNGYRGYVLSLDSIYDNYFIKQAEDFSIKITENRTKVEIISDFSMNPHFADTVKLGGAEDNKQYLVRSARQFNVLAKRNNWGYASNTEITYTQNIDISYDSADTGSECAFEQSSTFHANYISNGYRIRKINQALFYEIYPNGNVNGIIVEDPIYTSQKALFTGENRGTIENCSIRFSDGNADTIESDSEIAGFVHKNVGKISNCSVKASLISTNGNASGFVMSNEKWDNNQIDGAGIYGCSIEGTVTCKNGSAAGFCYTNTYYIQDSYCMGILNNNVIQMVTAKNNAAGFVYNADWGTSGRITNCAAYGSTISTDGDASGFCYTNSQYISDCTVRSKESSGSDYAQIQIHGRNNGSGFVNSVSSNKIVKDSYVVGTVSSDDGSAVGFCNSNSGAISYCYSNSMVSGKTQASGFILSQANWNSVEYCVSLLSVVAKDGAAYGFSAAREGKMDNCYSALNEISGNNVYYFSPLLNAHAGSQNNSFYLDSVKFDTSKVATGDQGTVPSITRAILSTKTELGSVVTLENTHSYHMTTAYPFPLPVSEGHTPAFWGDWPSEPISYNYGWIYYEDYSNTKIYENGQWVQAFGTGDNRYDTYGIRGTMIGNLISGNVETIDTTVHLSPWDWIMSGFSFNDIYYGIALPEGTVDLDGYNIHMFREKKRINIHNQWYDYYIF